MDYLVKIRSVQTPLNGQFSIGANSYVVGMTVKIASTAVGSTWMLGDITAYTTGTGALVVTVTSTSGSGTLAAWTISQSAPGGAQVGANADITSLSGLTTPLSVLQGGTGVTTKTGTGAVVLGTTPTLTTPTLTTPTINSAQVPTISGTAPLYMCRAWVNFNGTGNGTFAGGTSTVSRIAASTTATITTTNIHGLITGNSVYALTGVVAGNYTVTVLTATTFTITTVATTVLTAASITFAVNTIRASGNVSSIIDNGVGEYTVNFTTAMPDVNYSVSSQGGIVGASGPTLGTIQPFYSTGTTRDAPLVGSFSISCENFGATMIDPIDVCLAIFR